MKNKLLLSLIVSLFAVTAWADVSVVETYASNTSPSSTSRVSFQGRYTEWYYRNARTGGSNDKLNDGTAGFWLSRTSGNSCYLESTLEGGIKNVAFNYKQFGTGDANFKFILNVNTKIGSAASVTQQSITWTGTDGNATDDYYKNDHSYTQGIAVKADNVKLTLQNSSTQSDGTTAGGRIIVGPITITPYLLYTQKDVTVLMGQIGYIHDIIDNTDIAEGAVTYTSSATEVAEVDASTGEINPISVGSAVITATWNDIHTTYTVHVINGVVEKFSSVVQSSSSGAAGSTWTTADICNWETKYARRKSPDDQMSGYQYTWLAQDGSSVRGYIKTTNLEGGIKDVSFHYGQYGAEPTTVLKWKVSAIGTTTTSDIIERDGDLGENKSYSRGTYYTHTFGCAENAQLEILNMSVTDEDAMPASGKARLLVGDIYITPYLLYTTKAATLDTRNALTFTNTGLINNTTGDAPTYGIAPANAAVSINGEGQVTVEDGADVNGDFTITATWGAVTTTYTLHIISRTPTEASYPNAAVRIGLDGAVDNTLAYTAGYDGTVAYESSNPAVATVTSEGVVSLAGGVGQTTITATLPQTDNYKAATASYTIYVRDNGARIETFEHVSQSGVPTDAEIHDWTGEKYDWQIQYQVRRGSSDMISAGTTEHQGTSIGIQDPTGTPLSSILQTKGAVEGGIKYLSFYWAQFGSGKQGATRRIAVYADNDLIGYDEIPAGKTAGTESFLGINDAMKANKQLIIKNESYNGTVGTLSSAANNSRNILDNIYITPYLLYTTKDAELDMRVNTTYKNTGLINNTESGSVTYSLENNEGEATIDEGSGEVTAIKAGEVTVKATWSEGAFTTYTLTIIAITETEASYGNAEIHATMGEAIPANALNVTDGYDGEISYESSVPAVASFEGGVLTLNAPGQTKITATLPETSNYTAATASYILTVSYANYESFNPNTTTSTYAKPEENAQGDQCNWYAYIGGIRTPDYFSSNAITTRAQRSNETKQGYAKSAKLSGGISALAFNYSMMFADNDIENWDIRVYVNDRLVGQLTNEAGGDLEGINGRTLNPMRTKVITGIDEPGMFVIRFENHSTVKSEVEYESGNKGRFAIDNVSWENFDGAIVLDENADNSSVIAANSGSTQDVEITRSKLVANVWNTLCLPFAIDRTALDPVTDGIQELSSANLNGDELTVVFAAFGGDKLVAGKPYLVKPASNVNISGTYSDKQITSIASPVVIPNVVTLQGIFSPYAMTAGDKTTLFVGQEDPSTHENLFYPSVAGNLNGFRAYFKISLPAGAPAIRRARFVVNEAQSPTALDESNRALMQDNSKRIENGQLIIIRDGVKYNALGQVIE